MKINSSKRVNSENKPEYAQNFKKLAADMVQILNDHNQPIESDSFIYHNDEILKSISQRFEPMLKKFDTKSIKYQMEDSLNKYLLKNFKKIYFRIIEYNKIFNAQNNFESLSYERKREKLIYQTELYPIIEKEIIKFLKFQKA